MIKQRFFKFKNQEEYDSKYNQLLFPSVNVIENQGVVFKKTNLITFYLYNKNITCTDNKIYKCVCEKGMNLETWANSEYNNTDWYVSGSILRNDNTPCSDSNLFLCYDGDINAIIKENDKFNFYGKFNSTSDGNHVGGGSD